MRPRRQAKILVRLWWYSAGGGGSMPTKPRHFLDTLTDDDWQVIAVALRRSGTARALELGDAVLEWRIEIAHSRKKLLEALRQLS